MNNKVLIVEEDQESALKLQKTVRRGGYEAVVAGDGQEGIELFRKGDFNITITDLEMPVMSGREFIKNLKRTGKQTAIIVLTGNKHVNAAVDTIKLGIFDYVIKPFEENDLLLKIKKCFHDEYIPAVRYLHFNSTIDLHIFSFFFFLQLAQTSPLPVTPLTTTL